MNAPSATKVTLSLYQAVMRDVIENVRESFVDEGVEEAVLKELRELWDAKLAATKVVEQRSNGPKGGNAASSSITALGLGLKSQSTTGPSFKAFSQLDGPGGVSEDEDEKLLDDEGENLNEGDDIEAEDEGSCTTGLTEEGDPLNSEDDDLVNENADELFESEDTIVCQYEKIERTKNKWKFSLKDGVMNLSGQDYVFNKAFGESEF